jgi:hypothetical protein
MDIGLPKRVIEIEPASLPVPEPAPILEPTVEPLEPVSPDTDRPVPAREPSRDR